VSLSYARGNDRTPMARSERAQYRIRVRGVLDASRWGTWFDNLDMIQEANGDTTLIGEVTDQAALHGLINRIRDLGLTLVAVERSEPGYPRQDV
jgi:hypothetical protein